MASVQELIALANHETRVNNPAATAVESFLSGINQSQNEGLDRAIKLITVQQAQQKFQLQMQKLKQEQEAQQKMADQIAMQFGAAQDASVGKSLDSASVKPQPVLPKQKLEVTIKQDEKGNFSKEFKLSEPKVTAFQKTEYLGSDGKNRIGKFDPGTGSIIRSPEDPLAPVPEKANPLSDPRTKSEYAKAKTEYADAKSVSVTSVKELDRLTELNKVASAGFIGNMKQKGMSAANMTSPTFKATADVVNSLQAMVAKVLKSTFGGQLSDGEREYLRQVYGAAAKYSTTEREVAIANVKRMIEDKVTEKKTKLDELKSMSGISEPASTQKIGRFEVTVEGQ